MKSNDAKNAIDLQQLLKNRTPEQKIELLNELAFSELNDSSIREAANLVADEDKGVRNAATMLILANRSPQFPYYIVPFVTSTDISVRNLAGEILIKLGPLSVDAIAQFDHQNDDDTLKFVIDILGLTGDQRAALFILGVVSASENDNVILACIEALGNLQYDAAVDVMMLFYDRNELYKPTIVEALGKIGSKAALSFLMMRYPYEDEVTQYSILESLGSLGDVDTYFFLLEQVMSVGGPLILPLINSISLLKERYCLDIPFDNKMKSLLMYTISEGTLEHKKVAFNLIDSFDDKDILCTSLNLLGKDYDLDEMIREKIFRNAEYIYREISRIINSKPENLRQVLQLFLQTANYINEFQVMLNISTLDIKNIIHAVSCMLNHSDEEVRRASMEILFNLDPESALLFIDTALSDDNVWNRLRLLEILEQMNGREIDAAIHKLTKDEDEMVRDRALFVLNAKINNIPTTSI